MGHYRHRSKISGHSFPQPTALLPPVATEAELVDLRAGFSRGRRRDNRLKEQGKSSRILPVNFSITPNLHMVIFLLFRQIWIIDKLISRESAMIVVTAS